MSGIQWDLAPALEELGYTPTTILAMFTDMTAMSLEARWKLARFFSVPTGSDERILQALQDGTPMTKQSLCSETGLSRSTVDLGVNYLKDRGLIRWIAPEKDENGRFV